MDRTKLVVSVAMSGLAACAVATDDGPTLAQDRDRALERLERAAGGPITLEVGTTGATRVLAMTPQLPAPGRAADPAVAAARFLAEHHDVFGLGADAAASFSVDRVDVDGAGAPAAC